MTKFKFTMAALTLALSLFSFNGFAGEVDVVKVQFKKSAPQTYRFDVTLAHSDSGWDHYADRWDVVAPNGDILASRVLAHPHVNEQPFTRSLGGVHIPEHITSITIQGHDKVHELGGKVKKIDLTK